MKLISQDMIANPPRFRRLSVPRRKWLVTCNSKAEAKRVEAFLAMDRELHRRRAA